MIQIIGNLLILYQFVFLSFDILSDSCLERKFLLTRRSFPIFCYILRRKFKLVCQEVVLISVENMFTKFCLVFQSSVVAVVVVPCI